MRSRSSKLGLPVFLCALLCGGPPTGVLSAQTPAPAKAPAGALPEAKTIIDRHIEAIGGRAALKERKSTKVTATLLVATNGMTANIEIYSMRPNKQVTKMNFAGIGQMEEGFDGTHGWSLNPMSGPRLVTGDELTERALDADFDADFDVSAKYTSMKTLEKTTFDGRDCYKVLMVRKDGVEDVDFYDVATGLKAGSINKRKNEMGTIEMTTTLKDYKKYGPLLQPSVLKQTAMGTDLTTTVTSVEFDGVDPSVFDLPAQIKALIKK
jgi:hypothetical protein